MKKYHLLVLLIITWFFSFTQVLQAQISQRGKPYSHSEYFRQIVGVQNPLNTVELPKIDEEVLQKHQSETNGLIQFSEGIPVHYTLLNSGNWMDLPNGDRLWRLKVKSKGAKSLHAYYDEFYLPEGSRFFVYSADESQVLGAFTSDNNRESKTFVTAPLYNESIIFEYYEPAAVRAKGIIRISRIDHGLLGLSFMSQEGTEKDFGDSQSCNINVNCPLGDNWKNQKRSIARMIMTFQNSPGSFLCTGSLINNTRNDGRPFFLSAWHCQNNGTPSLENWVFIFNFESEGCDNGGAAPPTNQSLIGCSEVAKTEASDFFMVELNDNVPIEYDPYYNGWDRSGDIPTEVTGIHHPAGDIKKISQSDGPVTIGGGGSFAGQNIATNSMWNFQWDQGTHQGGSSGSPVFDQNKRVIGQLLGSSAPGSIVICPPNFTAFYGRLFTTWSSTNVGNFLDPENIGTLVLDGYDPKGNFVDFRVSEVEALIDGCDFNENTPFKILVRNIGSAILDTIPGEFTLKDDKGQTVDFGTFKIIQNLAAGDTTSILVTADLSQSGTYTFSASTLAPNDQNTDNDELAEDFTNPRPIVQSSNVVFNNNEDFVMTLTWTKGNGENRIVLVKEGSDFTAADLPLDGVSYNANAAFSTAQPIGQAYPVVRGPVQAVRVTGLAANQTYFVRIIEFSCDPPRYLLDGVVSQTNVVTDLETQLLEGNFRIFPNPSTEEIILKSFGRIQGDFEIEIYNYLGTKVWEQTLEGGVGEEKIQINQLSAGIYTVKLKHGKVHTTHKLIVH
ncbi:MAG: T9SS type A sorting domain-containing protein [Microscillaceae bacterium]|nr:T9SS type A sorting domain-containing protein [Microscillaceae bacterium]